MKRKDRKAPLSLSGYPIRWVPKSLAVALESSCPVGRPRSRSVPFMDCFVQGPFHSRTHLMPFGVNNVHYFRERWFLESSVEIELPARHLFEALLVLEQNKAVVGVSLMENPIYVRECDVTLGEDVSDQFAAIPELR